LARQKVNALFGHTVKAPQIAAVGDSKADIIDDSAVVIV
jgi:hypothetical protein